MSTPRALAGRVVAFAAIVLVVLVAVAGLGGPGNRLDYFEAMALKHDRLRTLGSPKVVVVGGSNATFGVDSEALERALCRPMVNMAMHAGLGPAFMVNEIKHELGQGDVVIMALEQSLYHASDLLHDAHYQAVDHYPDALRNLSPWHWPKVIGGVVVMRLRSAWRRWSGLAWPLPPSIYSVSGFDDRGDLVHYDTGIGSKVWTTDVDTLVLEPLSRHFMDIANELQRVSNERGATVVYTWPALASSARAPGRDEAIRKALMRADLRMVGEAAQHHFPDTAFLDTRYHLRQWGRTKHTEQLINDLCTALPGICCAPTAPHP